MSFSIKFFAEVKFRSIVELLEGRKKFNANQFSDIRFLTYGKKLLPAPFVTGVQKQSLQNFIPKFEKFHHSIHSPCAFIVILRVFRCVFVPLFPYLLNLHYRADLFYTCIKL